MTRSGNRPDRRERAVRMHRTRHLRVWYANPHQAESRKEKSTKGTRASTRGSVNRQQGRLRPARHTQGVGGTPRNNSTRRRNERSRGRTAPRKEKPTSCHGSHTKASHPGTITNSRHEAHERRPADAGIYQSSQQFAGERRRPPRTVRGLPLAAPTGATPHRRGSTPGPLRRRGAAQGRPARTGVYPRSKRGSSTSTRTPRTHGGLPRSTA